MQQDKVTTDTVTQEWINTTTKTNDMTQQATYKDKIERLYEMCVNRMAIDPTVDKVFFLTQGGGWVPHSIEREKYLALCDYVESTGGVTSEEWEAKLNEMGVL